MINRTQLITAADIYRATLHHHITFAYCAGYCPAWITLKDYEKLLKDEMERVNNENRKTVSI